MIIPQSIARSGTIASGQVAWPHLASGSVNSGKVGNEAVLSGSIGSGQIASGHLASGLLANIGGASLGSGSIQSGHIASGAVQGFFGVTRHIASGTVGVFDLGSGAVVAGTMASGSVVSGNIASGQIGRFHIASGQLAGFELGSASIVSGRIASGQIGFGHLQDGSVQSTTIASGVVNTTHLGDESVTSGDIASGSISRFKIASGSLLGFELGSGSIVSGRIANGQIGTGHLADNSVTSGNIASGVVSQFHLAPNCVNSGHINAGGTPDATKFLDGTFNWATPGAASVASGDIGSGKIASGTVQGFFGTTRHIASGTVGVFDFGSGAVIAGSVGSGAVVSGGIASGQIGTNHHASGAIVPMARYVTPSNSGTPVTLLTEESISGVRAVHITASGTLQIAMASVAARMPAHAVVVDNVNSGFKANIYTVGVFQFTSGLADYSGYVGTPLLVGRSGEVVQNSGSWNSGGLISGDVYQNIGLPVSSGAVLLTVETPPVSGFILGSGIVRSGSIGSGQIGMNHIAANSIRQFAIQSFDTWTTLGETVGAADLFPIFDDGNGFNLVATLAEVAGGVAASVGNIARSGFIGSGAVASGSVQGFFGTTRHITSGTVGVFDFGSGAVIAGSVGSGAVVSGNIASGQLGRFHIASGQLAGFELGPGAIVSGRVASGQIGRFHLQQGAIGSGSIAAGQVWTFHHASGSFVPVARELSVINEYHTISVIAEEDISGVKAVHITPSGTIRIAMASVAARMPAHGVVVDNITSGLNASIYSYAFRRFDSTVADYSGYLGQSLVVGRSGEVVQTNASFNSGGLLSGDFYQTIGTPVDSGAAFIIVGTMAVSGSTLASGIVRSGNIASGQVAWPHLASGSVNSGKVGNEAVLSGSIGSGQIGTGHLADGAVTSGDIAAGSVTTEHLFDGAVLSGKIGSGQIGRFHIASGQLAGFELGSGAIVSGRIASGQIGSFHHSSGEVVDRSQYSVIFASGISRFPVITEEIISGVRAVAISPSGALRIAMAGVSGRMPAVGIVFDNVASGIETHVVTAGAVRATSGLLIASGQIGQNIFVGRSGDVSVASGWFNSGGLLSGDIHQPIGVMIGSGAVLVEMAAQMPFVPTTVNNITLSIPTGELISGNKAVAWNNSGGFSVVRAERASGLRLPAIGVTVSGAASGTACDIVCFGTVYSVASGQIASGFFSKHIYVGSGGHLVNLSGFHDGASSGSPFLSGDAQQAIGFSISGGIFVHNNMMPVRSGFQNSLPWLV